MRIPPYRSHMPNLFNRHNPTYLFRNLNISKQSIENTTEVSTKKEITAPIKLFSTYFERRYKVILATTK